VQLEMRQKTSAVRLVEVLATEKFDSPATWVTPMNIGGFNIVYRLQVEGFSFEIIVRRPISCWAQFPEEKTLIEASIANYIEKQTQIPIVPVFFQRNISELGYYLIIKYIEYYYSMAFVFNATNDDNSKPFVLDPNISEDFLEEFYRKVASCLLELWQYTFSCIGSLVESSEGSFSVAACPIICDINDMLQLTCILSSIFLQGRRYLG